MACGSSWSSRSIRSAAGSRTSSGGAAITISGTLFSPLRGFTGSGAVGFTPNADDDSHSNYFLVPNLAFTYRDHGLPFVDVIGVTVYGNGGMNTDYPAREAFCGSGA